MIMLILIIRMDSAIKLEVSHNKHENKTDPKKGAKPPPPILQAPSKQPPQVPEPQKNSKPSNPTNPAQKKVAESPIKPSK